MYGYGLKNVYIYLLPHWKFWATAICEWLYGSHSHIYFIRKCFHVTKLYSGFQHNKGTNLLQIEMYGQKP